MHLTTILLTIVSVLMILSGLLILIGSAKKERSHAAWFFVAMVGGALWTLTSGMELWNETGDIVLSSWLSYGICVGSMIAGLGLLGYYLPTKKRSLRFGILFTAILFSIIVALIPLFDFSLLAAVFQGERNWYYMVYGLLLILIFATTIASGIIHILRIESRKERKGATLLFVGMCTTLIISTIFNMICPLVLHNFDFLWVGPLSIYILVLTFYLNLFSTHRITLSAAWFKVLSYAIIIASCAMVYMTLFFIIFTALFRVPSPSSSVVLLNFIMIALVLILIPVISEVSSYIRSLISVDKIDVGYVIRKLNKIHPQYLKLQELADFLADHLHVSYVGIVINKRLYESEEAHFTTDELKAIDQLKPAQHSVWQDMDTAAGKALNKSGIVAVAELCDDKGKVFGQVLIGKPIRKHHLERIDLINLEVVVNMIATIVAPIKRLRK